jgi:hypothetical protein
MLQLPPFRYLGNNAALYTGAAVPASVPATWNPADKSASVTLSNSDRKATSGAAGYRGARSTGPRTSGKVHVEFRQGIANPNWGFGIGNAAASLSNYVGVDSNSIGIFFGGNVWTNNANQGGAGFAVNGVNFYYALEIDFAAKTLRFTDGIILSPAFSFAAITGPFYLLWSSDTAANDAEINTGQSAFTITPSSGYTGWTV